MAAQYPQIVALDLFDTSAGKNPKYDYTLTDAGIDAFGGFALGEGYCSSCWYPPGLYTNP